MSQPLERIASTQIWCGRSWEGLVERRCQAFEQASALREATAFDSLRVVTGFLAFFKAIGVGLLRDEEEWVFRALRPTPQAVLNALEQHITVTSLIHALLLEAEAGCVDLRVVHQLSELLESHLLMEEEEVRPLIDGTSTGNRRDLTFGSGGHSR